ncbi:MAG: hypothetical protein QXU81_00155 [Candidatus Bathyarchaeia archaeon]
MNKKFVWNGKELRLINSYQEKRPYEKLFAWRTKDLFTDSYVTLILKRIKVFHEKEPTECPVKNCGAPIRLIDDRGMWMEWSQEDQEHVTVWRRKNYECERGHKLPFHIAHEKYKILESI